MEHVVTVVVLLIALFASGVFRVLLRFPTPARVAPQKRISRPPPSSRRRPRPEPGQAKPSAPRRSEGSKTRTQQPPAAASQLRQLSQRLARLDSALEASGSLFEPNLTVQEPEEVRRRLLALARQGVSSSDIARSLGLSRAEIELMLKFQTEIDG